FEGGQFDASDTLGTAAALAALAVGLFFFAGVRVVVPAFYALKDTRLPVLAALADCATFILLCVVLTGPLALPGIGLAASAAAGVNLAILLAVLRSREGRLHGRAIAASFVRVAAAAAVMGAAIEAARRLLDLDAVRGWKGAALLAFVIAAGAAIYWIAATLLKSPEPRELRQVVRRRRGSSDETGSPAGLPRRGPRRREGRRADRPRLARPRRSREGRRRLAGRGSCEKGRWPAGLRGRRRKDEPGAGRCRGKRSRGLPVHPGRGPV